MNYSSIAILAALFGVACSGKEKSSDPASAGAGGELSGAGQGGKGGAGQGGKGGANSGGGNAGGTTNQSGGTAGKGGTSSGGAGAGTGGTGTSGEGGGDSGGAGAGGTAGTGTAGSAGTGGSECNALAVGGPVTQSAGLGDVPLPMGGSIDDGVYNLTRIDVYTPLTPDSTEYRGALSFSGSAAQSASQSGDAAARSSGTFEAAGTQIVFSYTCPPTSIGRGYTVDGENLLLFSPAAPIVETYTRE